MNVSRGIKCPLLLFSVIMINSGCSYIVGPPWFEGKRYVIGAPCFKDGKYVIGAPCFEDKKYVIGPQKSKGGREGSILTRYENINHSLSNEDLAKKYEEAEKNYSLKKSAYSTLSLTILLSQTETDFHDDKRAVKLLKELLNSQRNLKPETKDYARNLLRKITERMELIEAKKQLENKLAQEQELTRRLKQDAPLENKKRLKEGEEELKIIKEDEEGLNILKYERGLKRLSKDVLADEHVRIKKLYASNKSEDVILYYVTLLSLPETDFQDEKLALQLLSDFHNGSKKRNPANKEYALHLSRIINERIKLVKMNNFLKEMLDREIERANEVEKKLEGLKRIEKNIGSRQEMPELISP